jgi:hypothetical protein
MTLRSGYFQKSAPLGGAPDLQNKTHLLSHYENDVKLTVGRNVCNHLSVNEDFVWMNVGRVLFTLISKEKFFPRPLYGFAVEEGRSSEAMAG